MPILISDALSKQHDARIRNEEISTHRKLRFSFKKDSNPMWHAVSEIEEEINVINDKESKRKSSSKKKSALSKKSTENKNKEVGENKREIAESLEAENEKKDIEKKNQILGVFVHYADCLKLDFFVLHPVVKVSLMLLNCLSGLN